MTGKKLDPFWQYTEEIGDKEFSCTFCERHFCGGVSIARFKSHIAGETCRDTKVCDKVTKDVQAAAKQAIDASKRKKNKRPVSAKNNDEACAIICHPSFSMGKGAHQSTTIMPRKICKEEDKCLVDRKLAKFIVSNGIRSNVIQCPSFIDFAKSLAEFGPGYEVPKPLLFSRNSIGYVKEDVAKYVAEVKRPLAETGYTLIVDRDYYSSESYINIFVYTPKGLVLETSFKGTVSRDLAHAVLAIVDNLGSRHVLQRFVGYSLFHPSEYHEAFTCASFQIEHFFRYLLNVEWVHKILRLARSLVKESKKHHRVYYYQNKGYFNYSENDDFNYFASRFLMLQAVLKDEDELKSSQVPDDRFTRRYYNSEFWRDGKELVQVLQPIFEVLNLVNGYMSTSGYLYEAFHMAKAKIKEYLNQNQDDRYKLILEEFEHCRRKTIKPIHMAAALLNPDYKFSEDLEDYEIEEGINYMLEELVALEEKQEFRIQLDNYRTTLRPMCRKGMKMDLHPHPRIWWEKYGDTFPVLRKYAIRILSQPCGMLSCHRYRLNHTCSNINYELGVNTLLMEKYYSMLEAGDEGPIDLDKLNGSPEYADDQDLDIDDSELNDTEVDHPLIIINI